MARLSGPLAAKRVSRLRPARASLRSSLARAPGDESAAGRGSGARVRGAMLFYHFTTISYLRPDLTPGKVNAADLPPLNRGDDMGLPQLARDGPLVWLTTDRASGVDGDDKCARITIKLPRDDHR